MQQTLSFTLTQQPILIQEAFGSYSELMGKDSSVFGSNSWKDCVLTKFGLMITNKLIEMNGRIKEEIIIIKNRRAKKQGVG